MNATTIDTGHHNVNHQSRLSSAVPPVLGDPPGISSNANVTDTISSGFTNETGNVMMGSGGGESATDSLGSIEELYCHHFGVSYNSLHAHGGGSGVSDSFLNSHTNGSDIDGATNTTSGLSLGGLNDIDLASLLNINGDKNFENVSTCPRDWDKVLCWPSIPVGHTATLPCFSEFRAIMYDTSYNATRYCDLEGIWNTTNYDSCKPLNVNPADLPAPENNLLSITTGVYLCGYSLSLAALIIAMIIFLTFKELRCLRNTIHTHLIITYILADTLWIITSSTTFTSSAIPDAQISPPGGSGQSQGNLVSCITFVLLHYVHLTNFFWMFVEGLYLYVLVVQTFVAENIKLRVYVLIGWGIPLSVVCGWAVAKWLAQPTAAEIQEAPDPEFDVSCVWLGVNMYDWIYKAPAITVLVANILFLLQIMWVLITKLRSATNPETQQSIKAAKALVVLMPLFGITYLLVLAGSREPIYEVIRNFLISTQGFLVALLYCFLNGEVRGALRHRWNRFRTMGFTCCDVSRRRQMQQMRDWSPRSRTESIRLYAPTAHSFRKRESSASEATTMTTLHGSMNSNGVGGPGGIMGHRLSTTYLPPPSIKQLSSSVENANTFI